MLLNIFFSIILLKVSLAATLVDLDYSGLLKSIKTLNGPSAQVEFAHTLWGPHLKSGDCASPVIKITDLATYDKFTTTRPQIVISGEIHGDERVGPPASVFMSRLLVASSQCMIHKEGKACDELAGYHITKSQMIWMAYLASRRDTIVLPIANCPGFQHRVRSDEGVDTNRDFPYSRKDASCLKSKTAQIFDALFRDTTVQVLVTFHGGMVAIGYEWGTLEHPKGKDLSPDDHVHRDIGQTMGKVAGSFRNEKAYRAAPINSLVYPVRGGMEDWAYAAGWDTKKNHVCEGAQLSTSSSPPNRAAVFLVETSDLKTPREADMGQDIDVLRLDQQSLNLYGGHVPRNTRLSLSAVDLLQPYVCIAPTSAVLADSGSSGSRGTGLQWYVGGAMTVDKTWLSWHASDVSVTSLSMEAWERYMHHTLSQPIPPSDPHSSWKPRSRSASLATGIPASGWLSGDARWKWSNPLDITTATMFEVPSLHIPTLQEVQQKGSDHRMLKRHRKGSVEDVLEVELLLVVWAETDKNWGRPGQGFPAIHGDARGRRRKLRGHANSTTEDGYNNDSDGNGGDGFSRRRVSEKNTPFPPQTHIANARTNPDWVYHNEKGQLKVQGKKYWPSDPLVVLVQYNGGSAASTGKIVQIRSAVTECAWWDRSSYHQTPS